MQCNSIKAEFWYTNPKMPEMRVGFSSSYPRESVSRTRLPAPQLAGPAARRFVRSVLGERTGPQIPEAYAVAQRLVDEALLLVDALVGEAVGHTGAEIEVVCRLEAGWEPPVAKGSGGTSRRGGAEAGGTPVEQGSAAVVIEVVTHHPSGWPGAGQDAREHDFHDVAPLAEAWGVTYRRTQKTVWFRLQATREHPRIDDPDSGPDAGESAGDTTGLPQPHYTGRTAEWTGRGGQSFLTEASELLAGQLDANMVAAIAGQLLVPRMADWCGVWLTTESGALRLSRVWHADERRIDALRLALEAAPPPANLRTTRTLWSSPGDTDGQVTDGSAIAFPLVSGSTSQGVLMIGRAGRLRMTDAVAKTVEDMARLVAQALVTARQYTLQTTISRALQRRQLPSALASVPGVETAIVYEPYGEGQTVGGDFYDLFPVGDRRWCFLLGDVQGKDPEAMSVTGLARRVVRLLAREGHGVASVLDKLNVAMVEESEEAVGPDGDSAQPRFLSLLYGELESAPDAGGARCTVASAGHPLPLRLSVGGSVAPPIDPQLLLGVDETTRFKADTFDLAPGETLLCVTDGVTERRSGKRQLDDEDGLSDVLRECVGLGAMAVAERVRRAVHDFDAKPVEDDVAVLVLHAAPTPGRRRGR